MASPHPPRSAKPRKRPESSLEGSTARARPESSMEEVRVRPESCMAEFSTQSPVRMVSPSADGSDLNPLQLTGRSSPQDDRSVSGFSKVKGMRAVNTPAAPLHADRRYFPKDMRGLLEIYEQGYTLQQGMKDHCKETTDSMELLAGHCNDTVQVLMNEMQNILLEIQKQAEKPANVVWDPVMLELAKIDQLQPNAIGTEISKRLTQHQEAMLALESRMEEKLSARISSIEGAALGHHEGQRNELDSLRQEVTQALSLTAGVGETVRHIDEELTDLLGKQHKALKADVAESLQDILRLQEKTRRADMAGVESQLEEMFTRMLGEHHDNLKGNVADNIDEIKMTQQDQAAQIAQIGPQLQAELSMQFCRSRQVEQTPHTQIKDIHDMVRDDVSQLFHEISIIQQAMNLDHRVNRRTVSGSPRQDGSKRCREIGSQTVGVQKHDKIEQTDDHYFKGLRKRHERRKAQLARQPQASRLETMELKTLGGATKKSGYGADEAKRKKMREALIKPSYNVTNYYYTTGCAQAVARSQLFEFITFIIIALNAIWIAVDTDYNDAVLLVDADLPFQIVEHLFCGYFSWELMMRFLAFKYKINSVFDFWFAFDSILVFGMVMETWVITLIFVAMGSNNSGSYAAGVGDVSILRMTRLVKMLRMARMARLLRMVPELVVIVKSMGVAIRSVGFFLLLAAIMVYVFAVAFRQFTKDSELGREYFSSVPKAMNTLLLDGIFPLYEPIVNTVSAENPLYWPLMMIFILLASITLMNMLVGVLVEVVRSVSDREREAMAVVHVTNDLREVMTSFTTGQETMNKKRSSVFGKGQAFLKRRGTGKANEFPDMSKETLSMFLSTSQVVALLRDFGVDAIGIMDSIDFIWEEKEAAGQDELLSFVEFVQIVLNMRGTNAATVKDVKEQMRLMKVHAHEAARASNTLFVKQLRQFRDDMVLHLNELRKSIDSDFEDDDEGMFLPSKLTAIFSAEEVAEQFESEMGLAQSPSMSIVPWGSSSLPLE